MSVPTDKAKEKTFWKRIAFGSGDESNAIGREKIRISLWRDDGVLGPMMGRWGSQQMLPWYLLKAVNVISMWLSSRAYTRYTWVWR